MFADPRLSITARNEAEMSPVSLELGYAASRINSNLNDRTNKFGWLQASATEHFVFQ
jgi:hypothetical protein